MRGRLLLLVGVLVMPALALIVALTWESYNAHKSAVRGELLNTAHAVASLTDAEVERCVAMLQTLASSTAAQEQDWARLDATARRLLPSPARWLVVVEMDGRQRVNTYLPAGAELPALSLNPEYVKAMERSDLFVSDLLQGAMARRLVVHVGVPFLSRDGKRFGFSMVMEPGEVGETLDVQRFAPGGVLSILDRNGRIIARTPHQDSFIGGFATPDVVKATREVRTGVGESVTLEGIPVLTAFATAEHGWRAVIGLPKSKVFATARPLLVIGIACSLLLLTVAAGISVSVGRVVVRSVDVLVENADKLGRGENTRLASSELVETEYVDLAMRRMAGALAKELQAKTAAEGELRLARDRLQDYAGELERKVDERTASLREAIAQMEEFSYTVSHDLRSPLRSISGYAAVLLEDEADHLSPEARGYLERIKRSTERMDQLTTDVLKYSRVARAEMRLQPVDLSVLVHGTIEHYDELRPQAVTIELAEPLASVLADPQPLAQALANLLTNAAKFVRPGERPVIRVTAARRGDQVRIKIVDNGIGVPPEHQGRLFRIFERAPGTKDYAGTGVGLAIVRKAVEKMGGTCGIESNGVSGSCFWIELKAA